GADATDFAEILAAQFGGEESKRAHELAAAFAGEYVLAASPWKNNERTDEAPYAIARMDRVPGKPYLKVSEEAHDMPAPGASPRRHRYEGALVFKGRFVHGFLRSCVMGQPKTYTL